MTKKRKVLLIALAVLLFGGILAIVSPVRASALAPTTNGDGVLSAAELAALNAMPLSQVTAAHLTDVRPVDLPKLDADLRNKIQTVATTVRTESGLVDGAPQATDGSDAELGAHRTNHGHYWRKKNAFGWDLWRFEHHIAWSWNGQDVYDVDTWWRGSGHWGYSYCGVNPAGEQWSGPGHNRKYAYAIGEFGFIAVGGCEFPVGSLGATHVVNRRGKIWIA